jgi:orotate phosphoribosyltransferase
MVKNEDIAAKTAESLLQIKAIKLQPEDPFTWASGWKSPIYCDNRLSLGHPMLRNFIREQLSKIVEEEFGRPDLIVGVATGAIAHGVLVAEYLGLPFAYVRSKAKGHGRQNLIEGHFEKGQTVVIIEDLISTGMSSLAAHDALKEAGLIPKGMAAIFTYGFDQSIKAFEEAECPVRTLSDYSHLLQEAVDKQYIDNKDLDTLQQWSKDPSKWRK